MNRLEFVSGRGGGLGTVSRFSVILSARLRWWGCFRRGPGRAVTRAVRTGREAVAGRRIPALGAPVVGADFPFDGNNLANARFVLEIRPMGVCDVPFASSLVGPRCGCRRVLSGVRFCGVGPRGWRPFGTLWLVHGCLFLDRAQRTRLCAEGGRLRCCRGGTRTRRLPGVEGGR